MAGPSPTLEAGATRPAGSGAAVARFPPALAAIGSLFFAWGFVTAIIDPLIPAVRAAFRLSYAQALLTQFFFFAA